MSTDKKVFGGYGVGVFPLVSIVSAANALARFLGLEEDL